MTGCIFDESRYFGMRRNIYQHAWLRISHLPGGVRNHGSNNATNQVSRYISSQFIDYIQDYAQDNAYNYAGDNGKVKAEVFPLDGDIAREPPEILEEGDGIPEDQE